MCTTLSSWRTGNCRSAASADVLASEVVAMVEVSCPAVICLSSLPPGGLAQARYFCKRLRARYPDVKILVGRWGEEDGDAAHWDVLRSAGADHVAGTLLETRDQLDQVAALRPASTTLGGARRTPQTPLFAERAS